MTSAATKKEKQMLNQVSYYLMRIKETLEEWPDKELMKLGAVGGDLVSLGPVVTQLYHRIQQLSEQRKRERWMLADEQTMRRTWGLESKEKDT